jgi:hypothetical protein
MSKRGGTMTDILKKRLLISPKFHQISCRQLMQAVFKDQITYQLFISQSSYLIHPRLSGII